MSKLSFNDLNQLIIQSAALRGAGQFDESISLIKANLDNIDSDGLTNAYLEIFRAAAESGDIATAKEYAKKLNQLEPGLPSVQKYL